MGIKTPREQSGDTDSNHQEPLLVSSSLAWLLLKTGHGQVEKLAIHF